jgi:hypothetical protein
VVSGLAFALAVLSKETALLFLPALLYIIYTNAEAFHRRFALALWLTAFLSLSSHYILFALMKGEFFPSGTRLGGSIPHASLVDGVQSQMVLQGGYALDPNSTFVTYLREWAIGGAFIRVPDAPLIIGGIVATAFALLLSLNDRRLRYAVFLAVSYWAFLVSGFKVSDLYIIPLVPLLALTIALSIHRVTEFVSTFPSARFASPILAGALLLPFGRYYVAQPANYVTDQTTKQVEAVRWLDANVPADSFVLIDNYAFVDLQAPGPVSENIISNAFYYWTTETDSAIRTELLEDDWQNIDYVLLTPQMVYDATQSSLVLTTSARENSVSLQLFSNNGWDVDIRKVNSDVE